MSVKKKVDFVLNWYKQAIKKLPQDKHEALRQLWIQECVKHEEYEVADALEKMKKGNIFSKFFGLFF